MIYDCLIIGGGPAGLTAGEYLGRFLRNTIVVDSGKSRARWIPTSHNYPGFPQGISGKEVLSRLRLQAEKHQVEFKNGEVVDLSSNGEIFTARLIDGEVHAHTVIVASGIRDEMPVLPGIEKFIYGGVIRFCPICDGYEALDRKIGIIGTCERIYKKARFLRTYSANLELFALDDNFLCDQKDCEGLTKLGVALPTASVKMLSAGHDHIEVILNDGKKRKVDILYPAMGAEINTGFLSSLGMNMNESGCVYTNYAQETNVKGLYAIGDITLDLSQISVAVGQAAIAATAIHNNLPLNARL